NPRHLKYRRMPGTNLRAARGNRVSRADEKRIRTENTVMQLLGNNCLYRANVIHRPAYDVSGVLIVT
ncbi:MAG TPA: hypothetical protein VI699_12335, partial [Candidatus Acidoferrales bacterium]|nr:hypothetical protein [Candidatus Acidoferrales bacterium]